MVWGLGVYEKIISNGKLVNKNLLQKMYLANYPNVFLYIIS
jgi:hypothetical protein